MQNFAEFQFQHSNRQTQKQCLLKCSFCKNIPRETFKAVLVRLSGCFPVKREFGKTKLIPKWTIVRFQWNQCCLSKTKTTGALTLCAYANTKNIFCKFCKLFARIKGTLT